MGLYGLGGHGAKAVRGAGAKCLSEKRPAFGISLLPSGYYIGGGAKNISIVLKKYKIFCSDTVWKIFSLFLKITLRIDTFLSIYRLSNK